MDNGRRLLIIHGMTGIGKTTLAERLAAEALGALPYIPVVLDRGVGGVEFTRGAIAILEAMDDDTAQQLPDDQILPYLLKRLRDTPVWLQLDSLEYLLHPNQQGQPEFADPTWVDFFEQWLRDRRCPSRLILTSQALPEDLLERIERQSQLWQAYPLEGLDVKQYLSLFRNCGVSPQTETDTKHLCEIATYFQGHPYILNMIAADIGSRLFAGNVSKYWQDYWLPRQQQNTAPLSQEQRARKWVNQIIDQLPDVPRQLLHRGAVFQRAVPETFYPQLLPDLTEGERLAALALLRARALVQETDIQAGQRLLQQHNLIRDAASKALKADHPTWESAQRQAAHLWLTAYQPAPNAPNLETVRGYLEAFDHYCELQDWEQAKTILLDQQIGLRLQTWGKCQDMVAAYQNLIGHLQPTDEVACKKGLGNAYYFLSNYPQAILHYQQSLDLAKDIDDKQGQWKALNNLGSVAQGLGQYAEAIEYLQQTLTLAREIGDRSGEGNALGNLGLAYYNLGQYERAIDHHQQHLTIAREIGDRRGEGNALGNLGLAYYSLGQYERAIDQHQQALVISREMGDLHGEGADLDNLGIAYGSLGQYKRAIDFHQKRLTIAREIGNRLGEGSALGNLGAAYDSLGQYQRAIDLHQQHLTISREMGDRRGEGNALGSLGNAYNGLGQYQKAIDLHQQRLTIAREMGDRQGEGNALGNLGATQFNRSQYPESLTNLQLALEIFREIGDRSHEAELLRNLAKLYQALGEGAVAQQFCQQALALATELGIPLQAECEALQLKIQSSECKMEAEP